MHEKINIESFGTMPVRNYHNHEFYISFWIEDSNTQLEEIPTRILIWESCDYDVNPDTDMNDKDRQEYIRQNFDKSVLLTDEMVDKIDEFNKLLMEIE